MKKIALIILSWVVVLFSSTTFAAEQIVNLYIWANYIPRSVLQQFQKETGINVRVSNFDSNETMYTKLKADPQVGYDVIVPSS